MSKQLIHYDRAELKPSRGTGLIEEVLIQPNLQLSAGQAMGLVTSTSQSEVQTLTVTGTPTGGTFKLDFNGHRTAAIAYNATAAAVQAALAALPNIGTGNVTCGGGALPGTAVTITFAGELANLPQNEIVVVEKKLTGGTTPDAAVAETTPGIAKGRYGRYDDTLSDGTQTCVGLLHFDVKTDERGNVVFGDQKYGEHYQQYRAAGIYLGGLFNDKDLVGLDANAIVDLKARIIGGTLGDGLSKVLIPA